MSGIFGRFGDKISTRASHSGPPSLSTPSRRSLGLLSGQQHDGDNSLNGNSTPNRSFTSYPSSPGQGRSLREFEEQMTALRKENFNLKLRIYFLEEKTASDCNDAFHRQNIDLKVENETLRKELLEKQDLLCQASKAMELIENQSKKQSSESQMVIDDLNHRIEAMTHEMKSLEKALIEGSGNDDNGYSNFLGAISLKDVETQQKIADLELLIKNFSDQNEQLCQKIESMESDRVEMTRKNNSLCYENAELQEKLEENAKYIDNNTLKKVEDENYDIKRKLADLYAQLENVEQKLQEKTDAHEKSLQVIKKACEHIEDLEFHVEQLKSSQPNSLSSTESAKNDDTFAHTNNVIVKLREEIEQITNDKNEEIRRIKEELHRKSLPMLTNNSIMNQSLFFSQKVTLPINESSFEKEKEKMKNAIKKICLLKQKLSSSTDHNNIEKEFLQLQLNQEQNDLEESEATLRQSSVFCGVLIDRLEELASFLNSLLEKKQVVGQLGYELRRAITKAIDRSLNLSRNSTVHQKPIDQSAHLSDCSMIDLVDSLQSSTVTDDASLLIDSLRSENVKLKNELDTFKMFKSGNATTNLNSSRTSHKSQKSSRKSNTPLLFMHQSESEEWSEPDRDVSQKRIGLKTDDVSGVAKTATTSDENDNDDDNYFGNEYKLVKKSDWKLIQSKIKSLETLLQEKNNKILEVSSMLLESENETKDKILQFRKKLEESENDLQKSEKLYNQKIADMTEMKKKFEDTVDHLKREKDEMNVELRVLGSKHESQLENNRDLKMKLQSEEEKVHKLQIEYESKCQMFDELLNTSEKREQEIKDEVQINWIRKIDYNQLLLELEKKQERLDTYKQKFASMEEDMNLMKNHMMESENRLEQINRNLDNATLNLSSASVERSKALNEKRLMESKFKKLSEEHQTLSVEKQELNLKIADLEVFNAKLQNMLLTGDKVNVPLTHPSSDASGYASEEANHANIHSPPFNSNKPSEHQQASSSSSTCESCKNLESEIIEIKKKMSHSKKSLEQAYARLRNQNLRKAQIEMDIKQQIVKTQNVLQNVRANMESELNRSVSK
ncbi:CLUMA_CG015749, isoform A [Clunio marinus]|uniref:CLUMA_CG015749, isoform A n=1 Tax=Clunio marinus TaxID=568069 RepID=A0A1J1IS62_9DIPT|nr:CLUMA_CG015749, isoform A [Clunio marinus]